MPVLFISALKCFVHDKAVFHFKIHKGDYPTLALFLCQLFYTIFTLTSLGRTNLEIIIKR